MYTYIFYIYWRASLARAMRVANRAFGPCVAAGGMQVQGWKNHDLFDLNQIFFIRIRIPVCFHLFFNIFPSLYLSLTNSLLLN